MHDVPIFERFSPSEDESRLRAEIKTLPEWQLVEAASSILAVVIDRTAASTQGIREASADERGAKAVIAAALLGAAVRCYRSVRSGVAVVSAGYEFEADAMKRIVVELYVTGKAILDDRGGEEARAWIRLERKHGIGRRVDAAAGEAGFYGSLSQSAHGDPRGLLHLIANGASEGAGRLNWGPQLTGRHKITLNAFSLGARDMAVVLEQLTGNESSGARAPRPRTPEADSGLVTRSKLWTRRMSAAELATAAVAGTGAVALLVNIWQVLQTAANERSRSQPIVVTHERWGRRFSRSAMAWQAYVWLTNEGQGAAFNVRFGVSYYGVRFAFRLEEDDPVSGNRLRVLHPRETEKAVLTIPSLELWGGKGVPEESAYYWARYENAQGKTWETRNPPDRSAGLDIRRVRFPRLTEWFETRRRRRLTRQGEEVERQILSELTEASEDGPGDSAARTDQD